MDKIRITKIFDFEMAHALKDYDGGCKNIHGHSYKLYITVIGEALNQEGHSKNGMLMDFASLKQIVNKEIIGFFDHTLILHKAQKIDTLSLQHKVIYVDYQPTTENLLLEIKQKIKPLLPDNVSLYSLKLYETATSYAEWFAEDNI